MNFLETLDERCSNSLLCIGLDPDPAMLPDAVRNTPDPVYTFCAAIIAATADLVCAYKPNIAFFEALGAPGLATLRRVVREQRAAPMIVDAKRGDIGSTATAYARAIFEHLGADAVTLSPYLGGDTLEPFLQYRDKGCFVLCKTSNPGSADLQDLELAGGERLYQAVARRAETVWNRHGNVGLVVGATHAAAIAEVRAIAPRLPLLVPGVGAQGGDLEQAVRAAVDATGARAVINSSRSVLYAGKGPDFAEAARAEALRLRDAINRAR
jgi:orotidine-5'-phosphate decarboxylase